jgi:hypothetical protein
MILPKGIATLRLDDRGIGGSSKGTKTIPQQILLLISKLQQAFSK